MKLSHLRLISNYISDDNMGVPSDNAELEEARDALSTFIEKMDQELDQVIFNTEKRVDRLKTRDVEIEEYV